MHVSEESDDLVVPSKRANNTGSMAAAGDPWREGDRPRDTFCPWVTRLDTEPGTAVITSIRRMDRRLLAAVPFDPR